MIQVYEDDKENQSVVSHKSSYESQKKAFEQQFNNFSGDNIFPLCQKYLQLIQQHESAKSKTYITTVYRLSKLISETPKYLQNVRSNEDYIRGWLLYISTLETADQHSAFQYLNQKSIGLTNSLFYMAWASCLEELGVWDVAEQIYQAGKQRTKCPKLDKMHEEFMDRKEVAEEEHRREREERRKQKSKQREKSRKATLKEAAQQAKPDQAASYQKQNVYSSNGEFSFEELRAMLPKYASVGFAQAAKPVQFTNFIAHNDEEMDIEDEYIIHSQIHDKSNSKFVQTNNADHSAPSKPTSFQILEDDEQTAPSQPQRAQPKQPVVAAEDPYEAKQDNYTTDFTIFTKKALNEINSMFCTDLGTEDEVFFEDKKRKRQLRTQPPAQAQPFFTIHEDNTQELRSAAQSALQMPSVSTANDKENQIQPRPMQRRRSSVAPADENSKPKPKPEQQNRRLSHVSRGAPGARRRSSILPKSAPQVNAQNSSGPRPSMNGRLSLAQLDEEEFDDDASFYLDTATVELNHDLSETINFNEIMSFKDAVAPAVSALQEILQDYSEKHNNIVDPFEPVITEKIQKVLIDAYSANDARFNDERGKEAPSIPDSVKSKDSTEKATMQLGTRTYTVYNMLGEGSYASVYCAKFQRTDCGLSEPVAVKVQSPACPWEFYICDQLQRRAELMFTERFIKPWRMFLYDKKSFFVLPYSGYGTLLDVVNKWRTKNKCMEESMVMFYTVELLKIVQELHTCNIIHGDIKPDNCLIMNASSAPEDKDRDWDTKGLILIDFGRSIDMSLYPEGTQFIGDYGASQFKCIEMQTKKPWTFQQDLYGVCGVVHSMLFNKYMEVEERTDNNTGVKRWMIKEKVKRYYNTELWNDFFNLMLNIPDSKTPPNLKELQTRFEKYIEKKHWEAVIRGLWYRQFM